MKSTVLSNELEDSSLEELSLLDETVDELILLEDFALLEDTLDELNDDELTLLDDFTLDDDTLEDELFAELEDAGALSAMQRTGRCTGKVVKPLTDTLSPLRER